LKNNIAISNNGTIVFALKENGTLYYSEKDFRKGEKYPKGRNQNPVDKWKNIVELSGGPMQIIGVRSDGKISVTGVNYVISRYPSLVEKWKDVDTVYAGGLEYVIGLKKNGSVLQGIASDTNKKITAWKDIVAVAAGSFCAFGLKSDGTVVSFIDAATWAPAMKDREIDVSGWTDIVAIEAAGDHIVGLKSDGTIVIAGPNAQTILQNDKDGLAKFTDIVAVSAEVFGEHQYNVVGLKCDGTVVAIGSNDVGQCDVSSWTDIIAVKASYNLTLGLKSDGTVVATGDNGAGQCDIVKGWKDAATVPLKKK
jgi:alpha-tubulin suppressor-like RCC1 family protein